MTEPTPAEPDIEQAPRRRPRVSAVWLVPLAALVISLGVAYNSFQQRGPAIEIEFASAEGIVPDETKLRFKNLVVGNVEGVDFNDDLSRVVVKVRLLQEIAAYVDADAKFWLVKAQVGPRGVQGLDTVISGNYIEGTWDADQGAPRRHFVALPEIPLTAFDEPGRRITLRATDGGSVTPGSPVLFKQIEVGRVEKVTLTEAGDVEVLAFVNAPHDARLTSLTRFWNASGFTVTLGASGAALNVESLAALVRGGIAFDTVFSGGEPVTDDHVFELYADQDAARASSLNFDTPTAPVTFGAVFDGTVEGLRAGAAVTYRGAAVGEVTGLQARVAEREDGPAVEMYATLNLYPSRFGVAPDGNVAKELLALLDAEIARGMRARLVGTGLFGTELEVSLDPVADASEAALIRDAGDYPLLPSVPSSTTDLLQSAENVVDRVASLPIEEVVDAALALLGNVNALVGDEAMQQVPRDVAAITAGARALVQSEELRALPGDLSAITAALRQTVDEIASAEIAASLGAALDTAQTAIANLDTATQSLPGLLQEAEGAARDLRALPLADVVAAAEAFLLSADTLLSDEAVAAIPAETRAALASLNAMLAEIRTSGAAADLTATLSAVRGVAENLAAAELTDAISRTVAAAQSAIDDFNLATADLPPLTEDLRALADEAANLPLNELVARADSVLASADAFISSENVAAVPPRLNAALEQLTALIAELRAGGAVENVNAALASAESAAAAVEQAAAALPALVAQTGTVARKADDVLASLAPGSEINRETLTLLREVRDAARAVERLAVALERQPNSVLFGR